VIVDEVYATLRAIRDAGSSLLIVEQHVHRALEVADVAVLLGKGAVRYTGPVAGIGDLVEDLLAT
jgi:branched-chain amino acid transport system ATP-binding protein